MGRGVTDHRVAGTNVSRCEHWRAVSQLHLALVMGRGVTDHRVAGTNGSRCEHWRAVSQLHLALVMGRGVTDHRVAGTNGSRCEHWRAVSQLHLALVMGRGVTDHRVAGTNGSRCEHWRAVSQLHLAMVMGRGVTDHRVAGTNGSSIRDVTHRVSPFRWKVPLPDCIVGDLKVLVPSANTTEIASWDRDCEVLRLVPVSGIIGSGHEAHDANRILRIRLFTSRLSHLCLIAGTSQGLERTDGRGC